MGRAQPCAPDPVPHCMRHHRRLLIIAVLSLMSVGIASGAISQASAKTKSSPRAHAAATYLTGIGDEQPEMFGNPLWTQLHMKIVRYIAPYDAATRPLDRKSVVQGKSVALG